MRAFAATALAVFAAASLAAATPASAGPHWHGGWGHHGFWGGPGLVFGLAGAAIAASAYECVRYVPVYDNWGNYIGRRPVNVC